MALHCCYVAYTEGRVAWSDRRLQRPLPGGYDLREYLEFCLNYEHDPDGSAGWLDSEGNLTTTHPEVRRHFQLAVGPFG